MKIIKLVFLSLLACPTVFGQYAHQNIDLLGNFDDLSVTSEPTYGIRYQGCWGWVNPVDNREYGIIGSTAGTYFIDVTDPSNPIQRDYVAGRRDSCIWHEYKSYGKYLYILSDDGGKNSFQIADLSYLPDSVHVVYDDTTLFVHGHTLYIDGSYLYVASLIKSNGTHYSMAVYSLANPQLPLFRRSLNQDYPGINNVHDMFVVNDTVYASCGNQGLFIYRYNKTTNRFIQLGALPGLTSDYNHSSFISKDHKTLYVCVEVPDGRPAQVVDVSDIQNPTLIDTFTTNTGATPHNPYVIGDMLVIAAYQDGVYTFDISNPLNPTMSGFFDTHPQNGNSYQQPAYAGCWGAYTDLPSGILLASDMQLGLFVLDISKTAGLSENTSATGNGLTVYPNPTREKFTVYGLQFKDGASIEMFNAIGEKVYSRDELSTTADPSFGGRTNNYELNVDVSSLPSGIYYVRVNTSLNSFVKMVNVIH